VIYEMGHSLQLNERSPIKYRAYIYHTVRVRDTRTKMPDPRFSKKNPVLVQIKSGLAPVRDGRQKPQSPKLKSSTIESPGPLDSSTLPSLSITSQHPVTRSLGLRNSHRINSQSGSLTGALHNYSLLSLIISPTHNFTSTPTSTLKPRYPTA
jgi:hypothetical protein